MEDAIDETINTIDTKEHSRETINTININYLEIIYIFISTLFEF